MKPNLQNSVEDIIESLEDRERERERKEEEYQSKLN
jgi:hypothetical protein